MPLGKDILDWNDQLRNNAVNFFTTAQEVVDYMMPSHRDILVNVSAGERKNRKIFDGTAPDSIFLCSSFLQGALFNPSSNWFGLRFRVEALNSTPEAAEALQAARKHQLAAYQQSNFYAATLEFVQDWLGFGNACVIQERVPRDREGAARLVFCAQGFGSYVFFEGKDKRPEGLIRELDISARECVDRWGEECSEGIKKAVGKEPFKMFRIVHGIVPRSVVTHRRLKTPKEMPWASIWVEKDGNKNGKTLEESGYPEKPFAIARYNVIAGEVMGRGLGEIALPPTRTVNEAMKRAFDEWDKTLDPPIDSEPANIVGDYSHRAGNLNILKRLDKTMPSRAAMEMRGRNQTHEWNLEDQRRQIRETFFVEQIRQLIGLQGSPNPEKTAFEFAQRLRLLHLILAPTGGRLQNEGLKDIVDTTFEILFRTGDFPPDVKDILWKTAVPQAKIVDVTYEGPLAKAQREEEIQSIEAAIGTADALIATHPEVQDMPDVEKIVREIFEIRGVANFLRGKEEYDQIRQLKAQVEQLQAALNTALQATEAMKNAAPMMAAMNGGQQGAVQ